MDNEISKNKLTIFLNKIFSFDSFREEQYEAIEALLENKNVFSILPTGSGKSLIYQFVGAYTKRSIIIISPLKSLMYDQVSRLEQNGFQAVSITSDLSQKEKRMIYQRLDKFQYIFLSPEMISQTETIEKFKQLYHPLLVVDEAHCISEWGRDFRQDYLGLKNLRKQLKDPQTLALTATAPPEIVEDVIQHLYHLHEKVVKFRHDKLPINRSFQILSEQEMYRNATGETFEDIKFINILLLLKQVEFPVLIYSGFRTTCDELSQFLRKNHYVALSYHAGLSTEERWRVQSLFLNDEADIVIATSAFGMGIDKKNIRTIIHYHPSPSVTQFIQETGRSGRNGKSSASICLQDTDYLNWQFRLLFDTIQTLNNKRLLLQKNKLNSSLKDSIEGLQRLNYSIENIQRILINHYQSRVKQLNMMNIYSNGIEHPKQTFELYLSTGKWQSSPKAINSLIDKESTRRIDQNKQSMTTNPTNRLKQLFPNLNNH